LTSNYFQFIELIRRRKMTSAIHTVVFYLSTPLWAYSGSA